MTNPKLHHVGGGLYRKAAEPDSVSKHNVTMSIDDAKKIAAGTHEISGLSGSEGRVILTPLTGDETDCDSCGRVFDIRNTPHEVIAGQYICDSCVEYYDSDDLHQRIENQPES